MTLSKMVVNVVRSWKEIGKETWENSLTYNGWWKVLSAFVVVGAVIAVLTSDLGKAVDETGSRHSIRAATLALGVAVMVFVSMIPNSDQRLNFIIRMLSGLMAIAAAVFWLLSETDGRFWALAVVVGPSVLIVTIGVFLNMIMNSIAVGRTAIKARTGNGDTKPDEESQ